jgi:hypothetical protein
MSGDSDSVKLEIEHKGNNTQANQQRKTLLTVSKQLRWERELLRNDLAEIQENELEELNLSSEVDLIELKKKKEMAISASPGDEHEKAVKNLHSIMYGAKFIAKVKAADKKAKKGE